MIQPNQYFDSTWVPSKGSCTPKKKKKSYQAVLEKSILSEMLTATDESSLEKLRCHSAGGANKINVTHGKISWGKLKYHLLFTIRVSSKLTFKVHPICKIKCLKAN